MNEHRVVTRSDFFRDGLRQLFSTATEVASAFAQSSIEKVVIPSHRPPGAIEEGVFLLTCTRCAACADACPHDAIVVAREDQGVAVGTPIIRPAESPCRLCEDMPCIAACEDDALLPSDRVKMGTAHISMTNCLAYAGQICDYCFTQCPLRRTAIVMEGRKTRVIEDECVGCGICEEICPAPGGAITVIPSNDSHVGRPDAA